MQFTVLKKNFSVLPNFEIKLDYEFEIDFKACIRLGFKTSTRFQ